MDDRMKDKTDAAVSLTRREAAALIAAAVDSMLLAAGLGFDEIVVMRRKLRSIAQSG